MGSCNTYRVFIVPHNLSKKGGAIDYRYAKLLGSSNLHIGILYCSGMYYKISPIHIFLVMTVIYLYTFFLQVFSGAAYPFVGTGNIAAHIKQNMCNSAHAYAANAYKMNIF